MFKKNINFEDDTRHEVSDTMLKNLKEVAYQQDDFGISKYKKPLHHGMKYDWLKMFKEEIADGLKYIECEEKRKEDVIVLLEGAMRVDNPKLYVEAALDLLKVEGTGK